MGALNLKQNWLDTGWKIIWKITLAQAEAPDILMLRSRSLQQTHPVQPSPEIRLSQTAAVAQRTGAFNPRRPETGWVMVPERCLEKRD